MRNDEEKMALKISTEPRENRQLALNIEVDPARVQSELRKAAQKFANDYRIPGFRKGKAPYHIIAQSIGLPALYNEFAEKLGQELYQEAIKQEGIEPYAVASLEDINFEPMTYRLLVPLDPEVSLGDYRALRVEPDPVVIDEADVESQLNQMVAQQAGWQDVSRPSQYGDLMNIDVHSVIVAEDASAGADDAEDAEDEEDEEEIVVLDETDWDVTPDQENPMEPPGLDEALLGLQAGDEKEVILGWPPDSQSIHAGKQARFQLKVNRVQGYANPEINDEFAKLVGPDFETLEDLKASIRDSLREQAQRTADAQYANKVLTALVEQSTLTYPPVVIEDQIDSMTQEFERQLRQIGIDGLEQYLQRMGGGTVEEYRERLRPEAQRIGEQNLVLSEVLRLEKLQATDEEIEERIYTMMGGEEAPEDESNQNLADFLRSGPGRAILESQILRQKALDLLVAIARGEEVPPPPAADMSDTSGPSEPSEAAPAESAPEAASETPAETDAEASAAAV
jgi:trigger factor